MRLSEKLGTWARRIKRDAVTLWFACQNPRTPNLTKLLCMFVVAYALRACLKIRRGCALRCDVERRTPRAASEHGGQDEAISKRSDRRGVGGNGRPAAQAGSARAAQEGRSAGGHQRIAITGGFAD